MLEFINNLSIEFIFLFKILIGGICGLILGLERSTRQKDAGITTHFLVGTASTLMMCISISFVNDPARIAAQIIPGISFLGAGLIIFRSKTVHGLTTAAGIWATTGIGMAIGNGMYILGIGSTIIVIFIQKITHRFYLHRRTKFNIVEVKFIYSDDNVKMLFEYFGISKFEKYKITHVGKSLIAEATIRTSNFAGEYSIAYILKKNKDILKIEKFEA